LGLSDAETFCQYYGVTHEGNFEKRSVLHTSLPLKEFAEARGLSAAEVANTLQKGRLALLKKRDERTHPFKDDKVLSSWNGLMIDALAKAGSTYNDKRYTEAAIKAAQFIKANLWKDGKLLRRYRDGEARFSAGIDDYAFLIKGVLTLFEEGLGTDWLQWAIEMTDVLNRDFKSEGGAFYQTDGKEKLLIRKIEFYDGAEPSGNGVHCENLLRLYQMSHDEKYLAQVEDILKAAKNYIESYPPGACYHLIALQRYLNGKAPAVIIALDEKETYRQEILNFLANHFCPHAVVVWKKAGDGQLTTLLPDVADKVSVDGHTAVYICREERCEAPLLSLEEIDKGIQNL
jgi:uncharacterized protein YyaL (SSP411 family)